MGKIKLQKTVGTLLDKLRKLYKNSKFEISKIVRR